METISYYIRSTVLGGEVVSDVSDSGVKVRTYVRAAGSELAWQNGTGGQYSTVVFQHYDASGSSYRTADSSGTIPDSWGYEGSAAELDPMGGNVSKINPYLTLPQGDGCAGCGILQEESPHYVNGQPFRATLDGLRITNSQYESIIEGRQFEAVLMQAWASTREVGRWYRTKTTPRPGTGGSVNTVNDDGTVTPGDWGSTSSPSTSVHIRLLSIEYDTSWHFSSFFLSLDYTPKNPEEIVKKALAEAHKILKSNKRNNEEKNPCRNFLRDKLGLTAEQIDKITDNVRKAPTSFPGTGNVVGDVVRARVFYPEGRLEIYNGFFKAPPDSDAGGGGSASYTLDPNIFVDRSPRTRAVDLIHEGIHLLGGDSEYGDIALANKLRDKEPEFTDKKKASDFVDKRIREKCK